MLKPLFSVDNFSPFSQTTLVTSSYCMEEWKMTFNNKPKPDDRSDNVEKLQTMVENTIENMNEAEETLKFSNEEERAKIAAKNERRKESLEAMREEISDESQARQSGYNGNDLE